MRSLKKEWFAVAFGLVMQAISVGINTYAFAFFVVPWMRDFSTTRGELMLAVAGSAISLAIWGPLGGVLVDRYPAYKLVRIASIAFAAGLAGIAISTSAWLIIAIFSLLLPAGAVLSGPLMAQTLTARLFSQQRGLALGITGLGTSLGGVLMPLLVTHLLTFCSWRTVFFILAAITIFFIALPSSIVLRNLKPLPANRGRSGGAIWRQMLAPDVLALGAAYLAPVMVFVAVLHNMGAYATDLGVSQHQAAFATASAAVVMILGKLGVGALADRMDSRKIYVGAVLVVCIGTLFVSGAKGGLMLAMGLCLLGIAAGGMMPLFGNLVALRYGPENFGRVIGVIHAFAALSGLAPSFAGWVRDSGNGYSVGFLCLLLGLLPASILFFHTMAQPSDPGLPKQTVAD